MSTLLHKLSEQFIYLNFTRADAEASLSMLRNDLMEVNQALNVIAKLNNYMQMLSETTDEIRSNLCRLEQILTEDSNNWLELR